MVEDTAAQFKAESIEAMKKRHASELSQLEPEKNKNVEN